MSDYELLDSGNQAKLERFGPWVLHRPSPQAFWSPRLDESVWNQAHARYERSSGGGGQWVQDPLAPETWDCRVGPLDLQLKRTGFGHVGVFTEQIPFWEWLRDTAATITDRSGRPPRVLNLFAYTGGSSIAAALGGAEVTHVDASRGVVQWASENAGRHELGAGSIRWIVDDALKFLRREARRGKVYEGVILDPPSFGRGPKGEVWKLEEGARDLLDAVAAVLAPQTAFVLLSAHTPGLGPVALANLLKASVRGLRQDLDFAQGEMCIHPPGDAFVLPAGTWARAQSEGLPR